MGIALRPGHERDYDECWRLHFSAMEPALRELHLDPVAHAEGFREQWNPAQVRIIQLDGEDAGWLQVADRGNELFLAQVFVEAAFQRRGIGTFAIRCVMRQATDKRLPLALAVVKSNPALRLYLRFGFRITHEDDRKFYMRLDPPLEAFAGE